MADQDKAALGTVAWVDLQTPDLDKARKFYGELLGWSFIGGDDPNSGFYTTAQIRGRKVAGLAKPPREANSLPAWTVYLAASNADDIARKTKEAGGQVLMPPMDVMEQGRMAILSDPTGAAFGVWQAKAHRGAEVIDEPGAMTWHEVYTRDATKAREFYARVFGLEQKRLDSPSMEYWTLHQGPKTVGGVMQMTPAMPKDLPAHWSTYFAVADADAAAKKVTALGGKLVAPPFDTPYGRMAAVSDPFGAAFSVVKLPAAQPGS
ncbi:MAG TPA: VOC family protein [Polyangiaceae bacterium]|nr:VOC family protein [Polyangiaceae bacterium]